MIETVTPIKAPLSIDGLIPFPDTPHPQIAAGSYRGAVIVVTLHDAVQQKFTSRRVTPWGGESNVVAYRETNQGVRLQHTTNYLFEIQCREIDRQLAYSNLSGELSLDEQAAAFARQAISGQLPSA